MEHSYLNDIKILKDYLISKLPEDYKVSLNDEYLNIKKDNSLLLLKLSYLFFNNGEDILSRIYFYTYDFNIYQQPNTHYLMDLKLIPYSREEKFLPLSEFDNHRICSMSKNRLLDLCESITKIFEQDKRNSSFLYKFPTSDSCCCMSY